MLDNSARRIGEAEVRTTLHLFVVGWQLGGDQLGILPEGLVLLIHRCATHFCQCALLEIGEVMVQLDTF